MNGGVLYNAQTTATADGGVVVTQGLERAQSAVLLVALTALTGGTDPEVVFKLQIGDEAGNWFDLASATVTLDAIGLGQIHVGPFGAAPAVLSGRIRIAWDLAGTVAPTSVTFQATLYGRS